MRHFVLTRFTGYIFGARPIITDDDWLNARLNIFEKITVPSIKNQSDKDFFWILRCDPYTPQWVIKRLKNHDCCSVFFDYGREESARNSGLCPLFFTNTIKKITTDKCIITTSLDSDDALATDHIKTVKNNIKPNMFFDFQNGLIKRKSGGLYIERPRLVTQFYSYMSTTEDVKIVYQIAHWRATNYIRNTSTIGWMQYNHSHNLTNGIVENIYDSESYQESYHSMYTEVCSQFPYLVKFF